jgi:two-component system nitrogen regulation sensor histidine kinase NtrY
VLADQHRRQRWEGVVILAAAIGAVIFAFLQARLPQVSDSHDLASNVLFVLLINLNIILLVLLVFLVGRNLIKLFYERRRKLLGSHLRFRLVVAFVTISLFPAILLFLIGVGFMTRSIEDWFAAQVEDSLEGSLAAVNAYYEHLADAASRVSNDVAVTLADAGLLSANASEGCRALEERQRFALNVSKRPLHMNPSRCCASRKHWGRRRESVVEQLQIVKKFVGFARGRRTTCVRWRAD